MNFRFRQVAWSLLLVIGQVRAAPSSWNETQLQLLEEYSTPLRWDNVEGPPDWVSGPRPRYHFGPGLHLIQLQPGEAVTLRAPANTWLRLVGEAKTLRKEDLEIVVSTDARMFVEATCIETIDPYALLVELSQDKPSLVRLTRPQQAQSNLVFAAYFSRVEPFNTLEPLRETVGLPGKTVRIRREGEAFSQPARLLKPQEDMELSIEGPVRLQLVARLQWARNELLAEQSLVVRVALDGTAPVSLLLSPELDKRRRTRVDHSTELVSDRMHGFFNVPEGKHRLRLQTSAPAYLSVFRQSHSDLLLPGLNGPATNAMDLLHSQLEQAAESSSLFFKPPPLSSSELAASEQAAWRLARDNLPIEAGAQAADWLSRLSRSRQDYPAGQRSADKLRQQRTVFREVLPAELPGGQPLKQVFFSPDRLRPLFAPDERIAVINPTLEQVNRMLAEGHFAAVPPRLSPGLLYEIPAHAYDSELRIAAMTSATNRAYLLVQYDQEAPFKVVLDDVPSLRGKERAASEALATMRVVEQEAHLPSRVDFNNCIGEFDLPLPVSEPGVIELPLPQHVRQVRIHLEQATAPVRTSVAYRAAKSFELGEVSYLALLNEVGSPVALQMLAQTGELSPTTPEPLRELRNHLLPLNRLLRAHSSDFAKSVDLESLPPKRERALDPGKTSTLKNSAWKLEADGQLVEAVETWNRLFWEGAATDQTEACLAIMRCLHSLGEEFLAAHYARYLLLNSSEPEVPAPAVALLENAAQQTDDPEQLEQLRAFLFLRCPCPRHLAGLTEALALNGQDEQALWAGLILDSESRPTKRMLEAALHQNWWQTFDQLVEGLKGDNARAFWRAQKHLAFYHFVEAEQELKRANEQGREMLHALQQGFQIRAQLGAPSLNQRLEAVLAWEQWQSQQPGPKIWQNAHDVIQECFATELLFNSEQNRFTSFLRAAPDQPVRLRFLGPLRLQLEARPILESPYLGPVNDWLEVAEYGLTNRFPVSQCVPNPSLQFTARRDAFAGVKTLVNLEWGSGWHEVEVALATHSGLIRVLQEEPVLPTRILPTLNSDRMDVVLETGKIPPPAPNGISVESEAGVWWVPPDMARPRVPFGSVSSLDRVRAAQNESVSNAHLSGIEKLRLALRKESDPTASQRYESSLWEDLSPSEQWLAACRAKRWSDFTNWAALPDSARVSSWLAMGRVQELLDSDVPRDQLQRLTTLLEISELFPAGREQAQCSAEFLAAGTNCPPGGKRILSRLTQDRTWVSLKVSPLSAGMRPLQVPFDMAQDPSTRLHRALLPPAGTNQFTLSGQGIFGSSMTLQHPTRFQFRAELVKAGFAPLVPFAVMLQVDDRELQPLSLVPSKSEASTNFTLAEGPHLVRAWINDPVVNQWVRLSLSGSSEELTNAARSQPLEEVATEKRFLHAATPAQPVRFSCTGPALLRVDEYRDGRFVSQLRYVPVGVQMVEIPPAPGRTESWYHVSARNTQTNRPNARVVSTVREPEEVNPPKLRLPESVALPQTQLRDYYRLGGQEDGTWTPSVLLVHRRPFVLNTSQNTVENEFAELNLAYRKAPPDETYWFKTEALARVHRPGDLTFALGERIEGHPKTLPFEWSWSGEGFVGTTGPKQQDVQWSLYTDLELGERFHLNRQLDFYPFATLFAHYLSLNPATASQYSYIDQDLYTPFRYNHKWGGILGSQLEYRPWMDTLLNSSVFLMSNENFSPDNWGMRFSWEQLMGAFRGEVAYQFRYFLKDADRSSASGLQGVSAGLYAEHWISGRYRVELGAQYRHDWPNSGDSYFFVFRWDFSQGRGYKDYSPHETTFRDLRSRLIPAAFNNRLESTPPGDRSP